jgi:hypothetical protein
LCKDFETRRVRRGRTGPGEEFRDRAKVALIELHDEPGAFSFQRLAGATSTSLTETHKGKQITVCLAGENLDVSKMMFAKYVEILSAVSSSPSPL